MIRIRIVVAFGKSVNEDAGVWMLWLNGRIRSVFRIDWQEDISRRVVLAIILLDMRVIAINEMVADHGVHLHPAQEATLCFKAAPEIERQRGYHSGVNAVLNR